jgi:hypothetical protein
MDGGKRHKRTRSRAVEAETNINRLRLLEAARDDAEHAGLLSGERSEHLSVRTTRALVTEAKRRTGISSNTELVEMALAALATPGHCHIYQVKALSPENPDRLRH